jgi:hypothetical protein
MNRLVEGGTLALLGRVPAWADRLWALVHRREGGAVLASGLFVRRMGEALDRLGLIEIAREGVRRHATGERSPGAALLRYHAVALFEHAARAVRAARALATEFLPREEAAAALAPHAAAASRIERLAADAALPGGLRIGPPGVEGPAPPPAAAEPELSEAGVGPPAPSRWQWLPLPDFADAIAREAGELVAGVAAAAIARIEAGAPPPFDLRFDDPA